MKCIVCKGKKFKKLPLIHEWSKYNKKNYSLYKCVKCKLIRPHPLPYVNENKTEVYDETDSLHFFNERTQKIDEKSKEYIYYFKHFKPYIKLVEKYKMEGPCLDIGCGAGHLLKMFSEIGIKSEGMEINPKLVDALKNRFKVHCCEVEDGRLGKSKYNLITFNQVLEHVEDPEAFIRSVNKLLKKEGYIIFAFPYLYGWVPQILRSKWYGLSQGQHLNFFSKESVKIILERNGFEVCEFLPLCVDYAHPSFPKFLNFIGDSIAKIIVSLGGGDNLFVIAKKKENI